MYVFVTSPAQDLLILNYNFEKYYYRSIKRIVDASFQQIFKSRDRGGENDLIGQKKQQLKYRKREC